MNCNRTKGTRPRTSARTRVQKKEKQEDYNMTTKSKRGNMTIPSRSTTGIS